MSSQLSLIRFSWFILSRFYFSLLKKINLDVDLLSHFRSVFSYFLVYVFSVLEGEKIVKNVNKRNLEL